MHFVRAKKHTQEDKTHFASQQSSFVSLEEASLQNTSSGEEKRFRGESSANNSPSTRCNLQRGINKDGFRWARLEVEKKHRPTCSSRASRQKQTGARAAATWAACASASERRGLPWPSRLPFVSSSPSLGGLVSPGWLLASSGDSLHPAAIPPRHPFVPLLAVGVNTSIE
jgi:hypothetical protein